MPATLRLFLKRIAHDVPAFFFAVKMANATRPGSGFISLFVVYVYVLQRSRGSSRVDRATHDGATSLYFRFAHVDRHHPLSSRVGQLHSLSVTSSVTIETNAEKKHEKI